MKARINWLELGRMSKDQMLDLSPRVNELIRHSGMQTGTAVVACPSPTAAITTVEYEPGLIHDIPHYLERLFGSSNGDEHTVAVLKSAFVPPALALPFGGGRLILGTWQQLVLLELEGSDEVRVAVELIGE